MHMPRRQARRGITLEGSGLAQRTSCIRFQLGFQYQYSTAIFRRCDCHPHVMDASPNHTPQFHKYLHR